MRLDEGMDTGDMLLRRETPIGPEETAEDLFARLAELGAPLMVETLAGLEAGTIVPQKQDASHATLAPMLTREDGRVDPARSARSIYNRWRGFQPWPGAWTTIRGKKLILHQLAPATVWQHGEPGYFHVEGDRLYFTPQSNRGTLEVIEAQLEGKRRMTAAELLRGHGVVDGDRLGS
jgi:methionyl-tRNA formyltransferase